MSMQLQFDSKQEYQLRAVRAVVEVFEGQPLGRSPFEVIVSGGEDSGSLTFTETGIGNRLVLADEQLLANIKRVQGNVDIQEGGKLLAESEHLEPSTFKRPLPTTPDTDTATDLEPAAEKSATTKPKGKKVGGLGPEESVKLNLTVEMETGTGKTYVYLRTIYELHRTYGFSKFVIVVPSVAIREGVKQTLRSTHAHFQALYGAPSVNSNVYNSGELTTLRQFATADALQILVMNIDAFSRDDTIIRKVRESGVRPLDAVQGTNPIVIVDEPQNMETAGRKAAIADLNPLCTLRYSATHKNLYNLVYSLNPVRAYDLGLVKQIEVDGITTAGDFNPAYVAVKKIESARNSMSATVGIYVNNDTGAAYKEIKVKPGSDLYALSNRRESYRTGHTVNEIDDVEGVIELSGGGRIKLGEAQGGLTEQVMRYQVSQTIKWHFDRMRKLRGKNVKVLSLFFIDRVANYRLYDEATKTSRPGKLAEWFEELFAKEAALVKNAGLIPFSAAQVHDGYFSQDSKKAPKDTNGDTAADQSTYALIMEKKEELLSADVPLQFIFSHSALREGWDNPNVFQICTLNESQSDVRKRQEIGRGLRLPVDANGERMHDKDLNILTVIANESYEDFSAALQREIQDETGVDFRGRVKPTRDRQTVKLTKELTPENCPEFFDIWNRIRHKTRYQVNFSTEELVAATVQELKDKADTTATKRPKLISIKGRLNYSEEGIEGQVKATDDREVDELAYEIPDVYAYLQSRVDVTRPTLFRILKESGRIAELSINPQMFLDTVVSAIRHNLHSLMVAGIQYERLAEGPDSAYTMALFEPEMERYLSKLEKVDQNPERTIYDYTEVDSNTERTFAKACETAEKVKFFFKLPKGFKIPTPLGTYNPDWAIIAEKDKRVYFVAETKSNLADMGLRPTERLKIACGKQHFILFQPEGVKYKPVTSLAEVE